MTIFRATAIDRSVAVMVRMVDGNAIAMVVYQSGECHDYQRRELARELRSWQFGGNVYLSGTLSAALYTMPLHGEEPQ